MMHIFTFHVLRFTRSDFCIPISLEVLLSIFTIVFYRLRWQLLVTVAGLLIVAGLLANLARNQTTGVVPDESGTYTEGLAGRVHVVNPLLWGTSAEHDLVSLVFSGLTRTDEHGQIVADVAEGWTVIDDGLTYIFTLREDASWHDGSLVTADDVIYTIGLLQDDGSDLLPDQASLWRTVTVDKLDRRTIRFSLSEPLAPFLYYTSLPLLPAQRLRNVTAQALPQVSFNQSPVGSGPFRLVELDREHVKLEAFDDFYGTQPYLKEIVFRLYPDVQSLLTAYQAGEIQGVSRLLTQDFETASNLDDLAIYSAQQTSCVALILNLDEPALKDRRVRRALLMAIDRQQLIDDYLAGQAVVADSPIFPGSWAYNPEIRRVRNDAEAARVLLKQAGWVDADGDGVRDRGGQRFEVEVLTNDDPTRRAMAETIARQWTEIGVRTSVQTLNVAALRAQHLEPRQFDAVLYGWTQTMADPDPYSLWHSSQIQGGQNYAGLEHRAIDNLLEAGRRTTDVEARRQLYREFQQLFADEVPALLLYYPVYHYGVDVRVQNIQLPRTMFQPSDRFQTLYRWYVRPEQQITQAEPLPLLQLWNRRD
ncbi:MAG: peptide ABC transporter substrate-binding protein [Anaerolineae bacterium]